jgi:hypothetical protein
MELKWRSSLERSRKLRANGGSDLCLGQEHATSDSS